MMVVMYVVPRAEVRRTSWCAKPLDKAAGSLQGLLLPVPGDNKIMGKNSFEDAVCVLTHQCKGDVDKTINSFFEAICIYVILSIPHKPAKISAPRASFPPNCGALHTMKFFELPLVERTSRSAPGGAVLCKAPGKAEAQRVVKAFGADTTMLSAPRPWGYM
jgi:hypothetical protein